MDGLTAPAFDGLDLTILAGAYRVSRHLIRTQHRESRQQRAQGTTAPSHPHRG